MNETHEQILNPRQNPFVVRVRGDSHTRIRSDNFWIINVGDEDYSVFWRLIFLDWVCLHRSLGSVGGGKELLGG